MGFVLHKDFTLTNMITLAVLDAQMNLTLSLIAMNVTGCTTSLFLSGDMLRYCHKEILFLRDLITRVFMRTLQYGIVVLGFLDAFVYVHHKHRLDSASAGKFGDCMKGRIRLMTAITPARIRQRVLRNTSLASRTTTSGYPSPSPDIRIFPMLVP